MSSLVIELQKDTCNSSVSVADLLRKSLIVAKKLNIKEFEDWIRLELEGYKGKKEKIPGYRAVHPTLQGFNPYHGWNPVVFQDPKLIEGFPKEFLINQPIGEIETLFQEGRREKQAILQLYLPIELETMLMQMIHPPCKIRLAVNIIYFYGILETVKNTILKWSLQLEQDGIVGENMEFSDTEKQAAITKNYHITTFIEHIEGDKVGGDKVGQDKITTEIKGDVKQLAAGKNIEQKQEE